MKSVPSKSSEILSRVRMLAKEERKITLEILHLISAVETQKIYADLGYSSAFAWLVEDLGYSHGAADRRLKSSRLLRAVPEISLKIESGAVNLTTLSQTQRAIQMSERQSGEKTTTEAKRSLTEMISSMSSQQTERLLTETFPELRLSSERVSALSGQKTRLNLVLTDEQWQKLEEVKALGSHVFGHSSWAEIIESLADRFLRGKLGPTPKDPSRKKQPVSGLEKSFPAKIHQIQNANPAYSHKTNTSNPSLLQKIDENIQSHHVQPLKSEIHQSTTLKSTQQPLPQTESPRMPSLRTESLRTESAADYSHRKIVDINHEDSNHKDNETSMQPQKITPLMNQLPLPKALARQIQKRDHARCTFREPRTGKLCGSRYFIQIDHIQPRAFGGSNDSYNLRCLCSTHNQRRVKSEEVQAHTNS